MNIDKDYADIFNGLGKLGGEYNIEIDENVPPVINAPRRVPFELHDKLK